jgi:hypothetical protein
MGLAKDQNTILRLIHVIDVMPPVYMVTEITAPLAAQFPLANYQKALQEAGEKLLTTRATIAREAGVNFDIKLITVGMPGEQRRLMSGQTMACHSHCARNRGAAGVLASDNWHCSQRRGRASAASRCPGPLPTTAQSPA